MREHQSKNTVVSKSDVAPKLQLLFLSVKTTIKPLFLLGWEKFSYKFMQCWLEHLVLFGERNPSSYVLFWNTDPFVRNSLIGGSMNGGIEQKPFGGKLEYDYIMWIDGETLFSHKHVEEISGMEKHEIVSGACLDTGMKNYNAL